MVQPYWIAVAGLIVGVAPLVSVASARAEPWAAADGPGECAVVTASARMQAFGYAHVVTLVNHCQRSVSCEVWTNVDPSPHLALKAKPGERVETIARSGSPSRDVRADKLCRFAGDG